MTAADRTDPLDVVPLARAAAQAADRYVREELVARAPADVQQELEPSVRAADGLPRAATASGCPCGCGEAELVLRAQGGDRTAVDALLVKYRTLARSKASSYFLVGGDRDDLVQEALLGVYKAIRDFRPGGGASFRNFAELCVARQLVDALRMANRLKHQPLNTSVSLDKPVGGDPDAPVYLADVLAASRLDDPAERAEDAQAVRALTRHLDEVLSDLEQQVLRHHVDGRSYQEIAAMLQRHVRSVDNALVRIRRKVSSHVKATA